MEYKKNEDGTYSIISETVETVRLEDLEAELANLQQLKAEADQFNEWLDTLPEEKKKFIPRLQFAVPNDLIEKISILKSLN